MEPRAPHAQPEPSEEPAMPAPAPAPATSSTATPGAPPSPVKRRRPGRVTLAASALLLLLLAGAAVTAGVLLLRRRVRVGLEVWPGGAVGGAAGGAVGGSEGALVLVRPRDHGLTHDLVSPLQRTLHGWETHEPCSPRQLYGYARGTPCFFLRLWVEGPWWEELDGGAGPVLDAHATVPLEVRRAAAAARAVGAPPRLWVWCEGAAPADKELLGATFLLPQPWLEVGAAGTGAGAMGAGAGGWLALNVRGARRGLAISVRCSAWLDAAPLTSPAAATFSFLIE